MASFLVLLLVAAFPVSHALLGSLYGSKCDYSSTGRQKCMSGLICLDGKCDCRFPNHQIYDESMRHCKSLVKGPCEITTSNAMAEPGLHICVSNAQCKERDDGYKECQCKSGYVESADGQCELEYGADCSSQSQLVRCDQIGPLYCRNGICQCKDEMEIHDKETRKCVGGFGAFCKGPEDCYGILECKKSLAGRGQCYCRFQTPYAGICGPRSTPAPTSRPGRSWEPETTTAFNWRSFTTTTTEDPWSYLTTTRYPYFSRSTRRPDTYSRRDTTPRSYTFNNIKPSEEEAEWISG